MQQQPEPPTVNRYLHQFGLTHDHPKLSTQVLHETIPPRKLATEKCSSKFTVRFPQHIFAIDSPPLFWDSFPVNDPDWGLQSRVETRIAKSQEIAVKKLRLKFRWIPAQTVGLFVWTIVFSLSLIVAPLTGQTLEEVRSEIRSSPKSPPPSKSRRQDDSSTRENWNLQAASGYGPEEERQTLGQTLGEIGWQFAGAMTYATFVGNPRQHGYDINYELASKAKPEAAETLYFAHYPYADGFDGYVMQSDFVPARPLTAGMQFQFSYGADFDAIQWYTGKGLFEWSRSRFGVDTEWTYFREDLEDGSTDELHVGDLNLLWRRLQTPRWLLRWGLGTLWSHDSEGTDVGLNGTLKVDYFPARPLVISGEYDLGLLGHATAQHLQLGVGATWNHVELFSAYDYRRFGDAEISGPVFGMRFWW